MITMVVLGGALGGFVFVVLWLLVPHRTSTAVLLARFDERQNTPSSRGAGSLPARIRLQGAVTGWLTARGITYPAFGQDLALTGRTLDQVMARKLLALAAGVIVAAVAITEIRVLLGVSVVSGVASVLVLVIGVASFFAPDLQVRRQAATARRDFRIALAAYLDLVALEMTASAAPAEALPAATRIGAGWPMALLRETLRRASLSGQNHWEALHELGVRIGVPELADLATLVRLVDRDGARVRDTLAARAAGMRREQLADAESQAGERDQSMLLAQILIGLGFIVFVIYPAIINVLAL